jgi:hypothetical protein
MSFLDKFGVKSHVPLSFPSKTSRADFAITSAEFGSAPRPILPLS